MIVGSGDNVDPARKISVRRCSLPAYLREESSVKTARQELVRCKINKTNCKGLYDSGADVDMIRDTLTKHLPRFPLDEVIILESIERPNAMTLTEGVKFTLTIGNKTTEETMAVANFPPGGPDVILGKPFMETRCPEALEALRNYGSTTGEKPMGGDMTQNRSSRRAELQRAIQRMTLNAKLAWARVRKAQTLPDEGYYSEEEEENLPPIRGLKKNPPGWQKLIPEEGQAFLDIFSEITHEYKAVSIPGWDCKIKLKEGAVLPMSKPYQMSSLESRVWKKLIKHRLAHGINEPSTADNAVPIFCVLDPPSEGRNDNQRQMRFVDDLRKVNENIVGLPFPLPRIEPMVNKLAAANYLFSFDVVSGYDTVPLEPESRNYTTFVTPDGLYRWCRMPQGLKTAPAIYQGRMVQIFGDLIDREGFGLFIYIDDIYGYADTPENFRKLKIEVFKRCRKYGIHLSPVKANFDAQELKCLGFVIEKGKGVRMAKDKIALIHAQEPPKSIGDIRRLQGIIGFYDGFIPGFADKATCITDQLKNNKEIDWTLECQEAWRQMCKWVREDHFCQAWDEDARIVIYTDASNSALGGAIMQPRKDDPTQLGLVYCYHRKFKTEEANWAIGDKELFAIIHGFRKYRYLLAGKQVEIRCDHRNLASLMFTSRLDGHGGRRARWQEELAASGIDFTINIIPGTENELADFISRFGMPECIEGRPRPALELACFNPKALTDIMKWFRVEGASLQEKLEKGFAVGNKKERERLEFTAQQVLGKSKEIETHLRSYYAGVALRAGFTNKSEKINDSGDTDRPLHMQAPALHDAGIPLECAARCAWPCHHPKTANLQYDCLLNQEQLRRMASMPDDEPTRNWGKNKEGLGYQGA